LSRPADTTNTLVTSLIAVMGGAASVPESAWRRDQRTAGRRPAGEGHALPSGR
jgi:hypothetical protein